MGRAFSFRFSKRGARLFLATLIAAGAAQGAAAAPALSLQILRSGYFTPRFAPPEGAAVVMGETITLVLSVPPNEKFSHMPTLPAASGVVFNGSGVDPYHHTLTFGVTPSRKGDTTIPAFTVRADDGQVFPVNALKLRVGG